MKTYADILNDLQNIQDEMKLEGDAVEINKRIAAYVYYHQQIDIVNAIRESSINSAYLMNSKIEHCMDNMYSVFRGTNPILTMNLILNAEFGYDKFDLVYNSNTFKLYAKEVISQHPTLPNLNGTYTPISVDFIVSSAEKITYCPADDENLLDDKKWPYYIDIKLDTDRLASNLSEHLFIYRLVNGEKQEVKWTRIFTEHSTSPVSDELLFVLTIPDYGIRIYKKGYFDYELDKDLHFEIIPYTTTSEVNLFDFEKITIPEGTLKSPSGYPQDELPDPNDTSLLEQVINIDDSGNLVESVENPELYQMILSKEIGRQDSATLAYQCNFSGRSSSSMISNNDILFLFSETFIDRILSCNFELDLESSSVIIYYTPNPNSTAITPNEKTDFVNKYDKYGIANSTIAIQEGNRVTRVVTLEYVSDGMTDITEAANNIIESYNNILGKELNQKELEGQFAKLQGVSYISSLTVSGLDSNETEKLPVSEYYDLSLTLRQIIG